MKKIYILSFFYFLFSFSAQSSSTDFNENDERHTHRQVPFMKIVTTNPFSGFDEYEVDDDAFNRIHPIVSPRETGYNVSVGQIICDNNSYGTGTLIEVSKDMKSKIITARHVVLKEKKPFSLIYTKENISWPTFYQGQSLFDKSKVGNLAIHRGEEICFHQNKDIDIVLIKAHVIKNNMGEKIKYSASKISNKNDIYKNNSRTINHYPFGVSDQRINQGTVSEDGIHTIPTLPGSSGASLVRDDMKIDYIHSGSNDLDKKKSVHYKLKQINFEGGDFLSESNISNKISKEDLEEFTRCIKYEI